MDFSGRLAIQQRVLPDYRVPFFETLADTFPDGLCVFAGLPRRSEGIISARGLEKAHYTPAHNWHFLDPVSPFYLCWQSGLLRWLETWQPQALVVEANPRYLSTRQAIRWMHARGRPVLGWGLGAPELSGPLASLRNRERRSFIASLDTLIAYSQRGAEEYRRFGFPGQFVFTAINAVAHRPQRPPPERLITLEEPARILFVGRLQRRKRVDILLQACAALPAAVRPALRVVGDGPARRELEALAAQVYPQAEFTGAKSGEDLAPFFAWADLFVLPGTGGLAIQEAMAYGLPVIVAQGDGTQADLVRPANGWLVPPEDLESLTATLSEALSDIARLRRMGQESYRIVAEEVSLEAMTEVFERAVSAAIEKVNHQPSLW